MSRRRVSKDYYDPNIKSDTLGSYTGCPDKTDEVPVQDADDL